MPNYDRRDATGYREIDRWDGGVGWLAHPHETGQRASHAVVADDRVERSSTGSRTQSGDGVWLLDPLDAPGVDDLIAEFGEVVGVAVLSNWHARDAGVFARRHDVRVHLPEWMTRVEGRVDAPVERYATGPGSRGFGDAGFRVRQCHPLPGWREGIAYRESDGTLYVPESMGTAPAYTVGEERLGLSVIRRPFPPRDRLAGVEPARVLVGHGAGVFEAADEALADALAGARRRFPRALAAHAGTQLRALVEAARG